MIWLCLLDGLWLLVRFGNGLDDSQTRVDAFVDVHLRISSVWASISSGHLVLTT